LKYDHIIGFIELIRTEDGAGRFGERASSNDISAKSLTVALPYTTSGTSEWRLSAKAPASWQWRSALKTAHREDGECARVRFAWLGDEPFFSRSATAVLSIKARRSSALSKSSPSADLFRVSGAGREWSVPIGGP
jgi:hypothetical protein